MGNLEKREAKRTLSTYQVRRENACTKNQAQHNEDYNVGHGDKWILLVEKKKILEVQPTAPWKKSYDKPRHHIKKQRYHFANKGPYVKAIFFLVVMYRYESWTIRKAECQIIDAFELWCWRRLLRIPWTERSNQSILKEINPEIFTGTTDAEGEAPIL